jgi:hypothetical protein
MMFPAISAIQFNNVKEANETALIEKIKNIDIEQFVEKIKENSLIAKSCGILSNGLYGILYNFFRSAMFVKLFYSIFSNVGFSRIFSGLFSSLSGVLTIPILITICRVFGVSLMTILGVSLPLLYIVTKIMTMTYGSIYGLARNALKTIVLISVLRLF